MPIGQATDNPDMFKTFIVSLFMGLALSTPFAPAAHAQVGAMNEGPAQAALLEMAHLKTGDELNIKVHEGGTITLTPIRPRHAPEKVSAEIVSVMKDYARTMRRLA